MPEFKNLDVLADQLYQQGLEKAQKESERLLKDAEGKAEEQLNLARREAEDILTKAKKEADKYRSAVESEVHQKAKQAKQDLKIEIEQLITTSLLDAPIKKVLSEKDFVKKLILSAMETWKDGKELELSIPKSIKDIEADLKAKVHAQLPGLRITINEHLDSGFKIENTEKGYVLSFSDSDFKALFEPYLTEAVRALLFNAEE